MIIEELKAVNIEGIIIPATLPPKLIQSCYPEYGHVAVMLELKDYFIIFEPAYFILDPIFVKKTGVPTPIEVPVFNATWSFSYDKNTKKINVSMDEKPLYFYKICVIVNPSLAVSYPINITNKRIPIVKYNYENNKKLAHLSIRIDTQKLEGYNVNHSSHDHWYERFDWEKCMDNDLPREDQIAQLSEWEGFSEDQCKNLGYLQKDELVEKVYSIIKIEWGKMQTKEVLGGGIKKYKNKNKASPSHWW